MKKTRMLLIGTAMLASLALVPLGAQGGKAMLTLISDAFSTGGEIPKVHAYANGNVSPPLSWSGAPSATMSFALVCDDPDAPMAGGWVHWVMWDIPATQGRLAQGVPAGMALLPDSSRQGLNGWKEIGWGGPQPPSGTHHYSFRLFALDARLGNLGDATRDNLVKKMKGHILAQAELIGTFSAR